MSTSVPLSLVEYVSKRFPRHALTEAEGEKLWRQYQKQIEVVFPSPRTDGDWELKSDGWVGHIPLSPDRALTLQPRIPLSNLFRMLDYAFRLRLQLLDGVFNCQSLNEFY